MDEFRICKYRTVTVRWVDASDELFPQDKALQYARYLVQGEFEIPSLCTACPDEEETEENRIADKQMNGDGNGHDKVENGVDETENVVFDMGTGVS